MVNADSVFLSSDLLFYNEWFCKDNYTILERKKITGFLQKYKFLKHKQQLFVSFFWCWTMNKVGNDQTSNIVKFWVYKIYEMNMWHKKKPQCVVACLNHLYPVSISSILLFLFISISVLITSLQLFIESSFTQVCMNILIIIF